MHTEEIRIVPATQSVTHHGDIVVERITALPDGVTPIAAKPLALGEHSGHRHVAVAEQPQDTVLFFTDTAGNTYLQCAGPIRLRHTMTDNATWTQEHHALVLEPATYKVSIQRVADPYTEATMAVAD